MKYDGPRYRTEAELCDQFSGHARALGWKVYPEAGGFDLLYMMRDGDQLGVHAKLRANCDVLVQAMRGPWETSGPAFRAVLVPRYALARAFRTLAEHLRIHVLSLVPTGHRDDDWAIPRMLEMRAAWRVEQPPAWVPPIEDGVPAGVPAPRQITPWKIAAVRLCMRLRDRGHITTEDFAALGISPSAWTQYRRDGAWLAADGRIGRRTRYIAGPGFPAFDEVHPELVAAIRAEAA